jgi:metal-sulfur cluster biosynthetic enzyme
MKLTEDQTLNALKTVIDPEIGLNIVDLGLVYLLDIKEDRIKIDMTLTTPGCPMHNGMTEWVKESIYSIAPGTEVEVNLVWIPKWTPDLMSDEAKSKLGY